MKNVEILNRFVPECASLIISKWIDLYDCEFTISKSRNSKLGDYRSPYLGSKHRISINHNLNPYAFIITAVHEFAHLQTWIEYKNLVKPHGIEWKHNFKKMMFPFFKEKIFPADLEKSIAEYMKNPAATSCSDLSLQRVLKNYDSPQKLQIPTVETLPIGSEFKLQNGRRFKKLERVRKRFKCLDLDNQRLYLVSPLAEATLC